MNFLQRTIKDEVGCTGIGIHSGKKVRIIIRPAPSDSGIRFVRADLDGRPMVKACFENIIHTPLAVTIRSSGCSVATIEHLMAAFFGLGIDNAVVEIDGPEVPTMDGSAAPFVFLIKYGGIQEQKSPKKFILIKKLFKIKDEDRSVSVYPSKELKISYMIHFEHPLLRNQEYELSFSGKDFNREISSARTFGFLKDVELLKENGFAKGGSLDNAIVIDDFKILNEDGLRFEDEFIRHKILDFIGDLSIVGCPVIGHFVVKNSGHSLNQQMLKRLLESKKHWKMVSFNTPDEYPSKSVRIPTFGTLAKIPQV